MGAIHSTSGSRDPATPQAHIAGSAMPEANVRRGNPTRSARRGTTSS